MTPAHEAMVRDLVRVAHEVAPDVSWVERDWEIVCVDGDRELSVGVAGGWQPQFVQIVGIELPRQTVTPAVFFRELSRHGMVRAYGPGERHRHHELDEPTETWTRNAILDGLHWQRSNAIQDGLRWQRAGR